MDTVEKGMNTRTSELYEIVDGHPMDAVIRVIGVGGGGCNSINEMVAADHPVTSEWITDEEMAANANLIKTMKVKPPMGQGRVRLVRIGAPGPLASLNVSNAAAVSLHAASWRRRENKAQ